jgi:hypothetical protein
MKTGWLVCAGCGQAVGVIDPGRVEDWDRSGDARSGDTCTRSVHHLSNQVQQTVARKDGMTWTRARRTGRS